MTTKTAPPAPKVHIIEDLAITKLRPHPENVRSKIGDITELRKSVKAKGVLEPLLVLPADAKGIHLVVAGHRRLAAAKAERLATLTVVVRDIDAAGVIEEMLIENLQRSELTPVEEAKAYGRLIELEVTARMIATKVGRSEAHIKSRLELLVLPDAALNMVATGVLTLAGAHQLVPFAGDDDAIAHWAKEATAGGGSWQAEQALRDPGRIVRNHVDARDAARAMQSARDKATKAGLTVLDRAKCGQWWNGIEVTYAKPVRLDQLELTVTDHKNEPCHQVDLDQDHRGKVTVRPVCVDPKRHTAKATVAERSPLQVGPKVAARFGTRGGASGAEREKKARAKQQRHDRRTWINQRLRTDPFKAALSLELVVDYVLERASSDECRIVCDLLQLAPKRNSWGNGNDWCATVKEAAGTTTAGRLTAAVAVCLAHGEQYETYEQNSTYSHHLRFLLEQGCQLGPDDRKRAAKAPKPDPAVGEQSSIDDHLAGVDVDATADPDAA